ncbi:MAG: hypothetical protein U1C49_02960 [Candidatus Andersenbacteria bacterium]|nr:hypothetical protein [bacterium]MDZ4225787.1 hypothetical protein [Candidatus Andersenbacteria bacterium]
MRIGIIGSMNFSEKMIEVARDLEKLGHEVVLSNFVNDFPGKSDGEKEDIKLQQKFEENAMRRDWEKMKGTDALLVINFERHGIANYIGGNTLFELAAGYFGSKKIFFYNPIPDIKFYKTELEAIEPVVINGDLSKIV